VAGCVIGYTVIVLSLNTSNLETCEIQFAKRDHAWNSPAYDVVDQRKSGGKSRRAEAYAQEDVQRDSDCPQKRTDARKDCHRRVDLTPNIVRGSDVVHWAPVPPG